jgi:DNA (cytosine-5)-methyltransferase 1
MSRPKLLDLFCGQGGASVGYHRAGWDVFGVDLGGKKKDGTPTLGPLRHYPFEYLRGDALEFLLMHGREFDAIHASPPCQGYSIATAGNPGARAKHKRLIAATRELLNLSGKPWVIENVEQAKKQMVDPIMLCGRMFGLESDDADGARLVLDRHRLFESNVPLLAPHHPTHGDELVGGVYGGSRRAKRLPGEALWEVAPRDRHAAKHVRKGGYSPRSPWVQQELLGIDWMTVKGMQESIPPVYAQHVGMQLLAHVGEVAA